MRPRINIDADGNIELSHFDAFLRSHHTTIAVTKS